MRQVFVSVILGAAGSLLANRLEKSAWITAGSFFVLTAIAFVTYSAYLRYPVAFGIRRSFAATAVVLCGCKALLVYHEIQRKWVPPGSHVDGVQELHKVAHNAIKEEAGYIAEFHPWHDAERFLDRFSTACPQPFSVLLETQLPNEGHYQHYDLFYLFIVKDENGVFGGSHNHKWVTVDELEIMVDRSETYPDVLRIVSKGLDLAQRPSRGIGQVP